MPRREAALYALDGVFLDVAPDHPSRLPPAVKSGGLGRFLGQVIKSANKKLSLSSIVVVGVGKAAHYFVSVGKSDLELLSATNCVLKPVSRGSDCGREIIGEWHISRSQLTSLGLLIKPFRKLVDCRTRPRDR
jgi:hypothetical protein